MNFRTIITIYLGIFWLCSATAVQAQNISTSAKYVLITDFDSGLVILDKDADAPMKPASMAKIMTIYTAFGDYEAVHYSDDSFVYGKTHRWSWVFLECGCCTTSVGDYCMASLSGQGNDAAVTCWLKVFQDQKKILQMK